MIVRKMQKKSINFNYISFRIKKFLRKNYIVFFSIQSSLSDEYASHSRKSQHIHLVLQVKIV